MPPYSQKNQPGSRSARHEALAKRPEPVKEPKVSAISRQVARYIATQGTDLAGYMTALKERSKRIWGNSQKQRGQGLVLLTRGKGLNQEDRGFFEGAGFRTVNVSLTGIEPVTFSKEMVAAIRHAQWLVFTSQAPVAPVLQQAASGVKIAVIGEKTGAAVAAAGFTVDLISPQETKQALVEELKRRLPLGTQVVYPKSQLADTSLEENLAEQLRVTSFTAYRNILPENSQKRILELLTKKRLTAVYLTSPSAWRRFREIYETLPTASDEKLQLIAIGKTTLAAIQKDGYQALLKQAWLALTKGE